MVANRLVPAHVEIGCSFVTLLAVLLGTEVNTKLSELSMSVPPAHLARRAELTDGPRAHQSGTGVQGDP